MIKVAIISDDSGKGGAYKVASDIANGLDKSVYDIKWFFLCAKLEDGPSGIYLGVPPIHIDYSLKSYVRLAYFPKPSEKNYSPFVKALKEFFPDIIHFHTHPIFLHLIQGLRCNHINAKYLFTDHLQRVRQNDSNVWHKHLMSKVYQRLFRCVKVIFISNYAYETALMLGYGRKEKDILIINTVDIDRFLPNKTAKIDNIQVIYLARIHAIKGQHLLLDAWQKVAKNNNVSLHLYGVEADEGSVNNRINQESFPNPVFYEGVTSSPESVLQDAQIGVFPSFREGLPLALLEMMASGLSIAASDIPEIKSIITDGKDGLLFNCGDEIDLADKLQQLIDSESLRNQLGKEARKTIEKSYSEPMVDKYSKLYQSLEKHNC